ncbi:hypothetical protein TNCV_1469821 [Trichonephila clavipes]|nr:hypothetical protein TNCV_1469821 [Trichonephila clavipes]
MKRATAKTKRFCPESRRKGEKEKPLSGAMLTKIRWNAGDGAFSHVFQLDTLRENCGIIRKQASTDGGVLWKVMCVDVVQVRWAVPADSVFASKVQKSAAGDENSGR